jgi:hypothetical protein
MKNSNQKVMQNYGNFFNPPKRGMGIVDKWSIDDGQEKLFRELHNHKFSSRLLVRQGLVNRQVFPGF